MRKFVIMWLSSWSMILLPAVCLRSADSFAAAPPAATLRRSRVHIYSNTPPLKMKMAANGKWMEQGARREERISYLKAKGALSESESAELNGLVSKGLQFEEQYNTLTFSDEHASFKASHNAVLAALAEHCSVGRGRDGCNIFYLDGPDAATTRTLLRHGIQSSRCYVANRHASSCEALVSAGLPEANVCHDWAEEALRRPVPAERRTLSDAGGRFGAVDFGCFYFDGCGGFAPIVVEMATAALGARRDTRPSAPVALGYTLAGGGRDIVDRELFVTRAVVRLATAAGFARVAHVLDDPMRYGVEPATQKRDGGTFTSWLVLEP